MSREYRDEIKALIRGGSGGAWARTERAYRQSTLPTVGGKRQPKPGAEGITKRLKRASGYLLSRSTFGGKRSGRFA